MENPSAQSDNEKGQKLQKIWDAVCALEGEVFYTLKGLEYTYTIRGNEIFFSRKEKSVTRASVELAFQKAEALGGVVKGPKKLEVFGASYLYPVFMRLGLIRKP